MMLFWRRGYEATSLQDLVDELGINRFSLYNTFGDKQTLFARVVDVYEQRVFGPLLKTLEPPGEGLTRLETYLDTLAKGLRQQPAVNGCFLQNTVLAGEVRDTQVLNHIRDVFQRLQAALAEVVDGAKAQGEIDESESTQELADYLLMQVQGLIALHGLGAPERAENALRQLKQQIRKW
nr:TetR/AcrR family transcriptional regulator [Aestuariicella hydrocarbonica]